MNAIYEAAKTGDLERIISLHERGPCLVVKMKANGDVQDICQARHAQVELEKQALTSELSNKLPLDVVKHCLYTFI